MKKHKTVRQPKTSLLLRTKTQFCLYTACHFKCIVLWTVWFSANRFYILIMTLFVFEDNSLLKKSQNLTKSTLYPWLWVTDMIISHLTNIIIFHSELHMMCANHKKIQWFPNSWMTKPFILRLNVGLSPSVLSHHWGFTVCSTGLFSNGLPHKPALLCEETEWTFSYLLGSTEKCRFLSLQNTTWGNFIYLRTKTQNVSQKG